MSRAACIGSRDLNPSQLGVCEKLGSWLATNQWEVHSGNAPGADQAFARGASFVRPELVHLWLPWKGFNMGAFEPGNHVAALDQLPAKQLEMYEKVASRHHPIWNRLTQGPRKLHTRNVAIVMPEVYQDQMGVLVGRPVDLVLAFPSQTKKGGGGTGQGMRVAKAVGAEVIDLNQLTKSDLHALCERIAAWGKHSE